MVTCACGNPANGSGTTCQRCSALHELGLKAGATDAEVKTAYRLYVKAWHPDRFPGDERSKSAAQERLKAINSAYDYLTSSPSKGQTHRPKAEAAPPRPQEPSQQKQSSPKQPSPAGGRDQEPPPKPNTGGQAPPPKPSAARRWGILFGLLADRFRRAPRWLWAASVAVALVTVFTTAWIFWPKPTSSAQIYYEAGAKKYELTDTSPNIAKIEQQAKALDKQNRYSEAVPLFNQACAGGIGDACDHLGSIYFYGGTGTKNYLTAAAFFTKACDAGKSDGCYNLGGMYEFGEGVALDHAKAAALWSKACDAGNIDGCTDLGASYDKGEGVKRDYHRAVALFSKACDSGRTLGCHNLGIMYLEGRGVSKDTTKAGHLFKRGCDIGFKESCDEMKELRERE
jgi:TPR repeat protein